MSKEEKRALAMLASAILYLTELRVFSHPTMPEWENYNDAIDTMRIAEIEVRG